MTTREPIIIDLPSPTVGEAEYTAALTQYCEARGISTRVLYQPCPIGRIDECLSHRRTEAQERHEAEQAEYRSTFWLSLVGLVGSLAALGLLWALRVPVEALNVGAIVPMGCAAFGFKAAMHIKWRAR